jgi:hypothetical protein
VAPLDVGAEDEGVPDEAGEQVGPPRRVEALPALPQLGEVAPVLGHLDEVDRRVALAPPAERRVGPRGARQDQALDAVRRAGGQLEGHDAAGVVAQQGDALDPQGVQQGEGAGGVGLDAVLGQRRRRAEPEGVHGEHPASGGEQGQQLGVLVARARGRVQQQQGRAAAARLDVVQRADPGRREVRGRCHAPTGTAAAARKARLSGL